MKQMTAGRSKLKLHAIKQNINIWRSANFSLSMAHCPLDKTQKKQNRNSTNFDTDTAQNSAKYCLFVSENLPSRKDVTRACVCEPQPLGAHTHQITHYLNVVCLCVCKKYIHIILNSSVNFSLTYFCL
jgi:hypothetical protein